MGEVQQETDGISFMVTNGNHMRQITGVQQTIITINEF